MKNKVNIFRKTKLLFLCLLAASFIVSCVGDEIFRDDLPDSNSQVDTKLPQANFSYTVDEDDYTTIHFQDLSSESNTYLWDFGNGDTSMEQDPTYTFTAGEGVYPVTYTTGDSNGATSSITMDVIVEEPELPAVPDPSIVNDTFDVLPKSSGSDCACAGWINRDIGDQGESSTVSGVSGFLKFDNNEPDHVYQEFEVVPNADYIIDVVVGFQSSQGGSLPSSFELRVLAGTGYTSGYTPVYYTDTALMPQGNSATGLWGYNSVAQVEDPANNLLVEAVSHPGNTDYITYTYIFNSGANNSVALFMRGLGGPATGGAGGDYGYNNGDEEIRADSITITAINE
ncbi:PKD domain-containing protein [Winogradskyella pulchriflava]|uniref:PKD domain-containing protein n=1 Tax=Winogradskyella pulchriflava TaxID=1110688 RepID=A0ABV6QCS9_9FLAO